MFSPSVRWRSSRPSRSARFSADFTQRRCRDCAAAAGRTRHGTPDWRRYRRAPSSHRDAAWCPHRGQHCRMDAPHRTDADRRPHWRDRARCSPRSADAPPRAPCGRTACPPCVGERDREAVVAAPLPVVDPQRRVAKDQGFNKARFTSMRWEERPPMPPAFWTQQCSRRQ